ncbi:putative glycerophosphoryl diester phosphodiesterase [Leptomonas pyrrhocoris]|uniref:Putative glycerophosphoryl diester phosphodiesterase n=1 Tax=Leptomonas pyrrhocoris TaxID=157538 RepID=A0A0N0VFP0_LEPPY|nr:putative glycerophosphoryl diester phosphodiesterase [Leptomonas pyrrhocoris]XP_015660184.1 putative glycerophosphoryl diester phosphodiesterase [Leptomonas pyrrhocoris]KPA81744.1 putative glycerophosphoryl diester phosphodiesterase [Leptomonas pyrrhocoris]KPA81745.1 putative glycerophosphoryl diester phosphodiesterase [Leptomonas pyrrhocoris]|eukprot:XP_015660183.1 putative glycerophosphoryl diester phosphodiesterase [Leptomonas pyrrhocoris]
MFAVEKLQQQSQAVAPHENQASRNSPNRPFIRDAPTVRPHLALPIHTPDSSFPVRVACHRGDWRNYVENTLEAVESCIQMGADIVEVDVWRTKDGALILMHDETLERCTSGHGKICDHTLAEIRELRMKDGLGNMTEFTVPTAEEVLLLAKDRVVVNLDKADLYLDEAYQLLVKTGMVAQTILKSDIPYDNLCKRYGEELLNKVIFMPIVNVTDATTYEEVEHIFAPHHDLYEINFEKENVAILQYIRKLAKATGAVLWINTIWPTTCGGHSDDHALRNKEDNWGYVADHIGAGIMQTDRPAMLLEYLKNRGSR